MSTHHVSGRTLAFALAMAVVAAPTGSARAAGLLVADGGFGGVLEIETHTVDVVINNGIAVTRVTQVFRNTENRQVEALYTFPVPKGASVANFSMWINGKEMVGEVLEKKRARQIYNSYKRRRRDPGLLEQTDYKTFEMRIFPIGPRAQQRVEVTYYQELDFDHDWIRYVYPLATVTRKDIQQRTQGTFSLSLQLKSEVPITGMESPSHADEFVIVKHTENYQQASLETDGGDLSRDLVINCRLQRPHTGVDIVTSRPDGEDGFFSLTLTAGQELPREDTAMDYVFILDISGSMANGGKLRISRDSLAAFIAGLSPEDRFELIAFNVQPALLFKDLQPANDVNKGQGLRFLDDQRARGGTVLAPAMQAAYRYGDPDRPLNVVILSDGMTEQGERAELLGLIRAKPANVRVFCVGVGNEVNRPLLRQLAEDAGGLAAFLSRGDNFAQAAKAFRRKLMHPVASDLTLTFEGVDVYDLEPRKLPNLYHGMPVRLYGRYRGGGPAKIRIVADVQGKATTQTVEFDFPKDEDANPEIERMWAWHRVQRLLRDADRSGARSGVVDEIVRLGEGFSIVTEYTSFLVLENDAEFARWKIERRNLLRIKRDRRGQRAVAERLAALRRQAVQQLGPGALDALQEKTQSPKASQPPARQAPAARPVAARDNGSTRTTRPTSTRRSTRRRRNVDFGGGGAIDPISGGIALGLAALAAAAGRRRKEEDASEGGEA